jgi:hypothetical protein
LLVNGGFNGSAASWQLAGGATYNNAISNDADGCPGSGSIAFAGPGSTVDQCYKMATGAGMYTMGLRFRQSQGGGVGCLVSFYADQNCTSSSGFDFINLVTDGSENLWSSTRDSVNAPSGTMSVLVHCMSNGGTAIIDQLYLNVNQANPSF